MRHARTVPAALVLGALVLSGCSGGSSPSADPSTSASSGGTTSSAPSSTAGSPSGSASSSAPASPFTTPSPTRLPAVRLKATGYHLAVLNSSVAETDEERAVVVAWMTYWQAVTDTGYRQREDPGLAAVSTPAARRTILDYLATQKKQGRRVVGWAKDNVVAISVDGDRARLHDCTRNFTFSVDADGTPVTLPDRYYDVRGTLVRKGGRWLVATAPSHAQSTPCTGG